MVESLGRSLFTIRNAFALSCLGFIATSVSLLIDFSQTKDLRDKMIARQLTGTPPSQVEQAAPAPITKMSIPPELSLDEKRFRLLNSYKLSFKRDFDPVSRIVNDIFGTATLILPEKKVELKIRLKPASTLLTEVRYIPAFVADANQPKTSVASALYTEDFSSEDDSISLHWDGSQLKDFSDSLEKYSDVILTFQLRKKTDIQPVTARTLFDAKSPTEVIGKFEYSSW